MTKFDYFDEEDNLLYGSVTVEGILSILDKHLNDGEEINGLLECKIEQHKKYMEYLSKANSNIESL
ncbi:hypothetical protein [Clostridium sp. YIM B02555]|uniref:hypothetical protein n=1 Tax=Clostridium sp. YIM B02555 TaxID=2911968 RepID=UPI001EEF52C0|nr:hypothetical protein [Clostridium sp. YIM B02555]